METTLTQTETVETPEAANGVKLQVHGANAGGMTIYGVSEQEVADALFEYMHHTKRWSLRRSGRMFLPPATIPTPTADDPPDH